MNYLVKKFYNLGIVFLCGVANLYAESWTLEGAIQTAMEKNPEIVVVLHQHLVEAIDDVRTESSFE